MASKLKSILKSCNTKKVVTLMSCIGLCVALGIVAYAGEASPQPLVSASDLQLVRDFGADAKATIPIMLGEIIPLSLGISLLPLFLYKGINWVMGAIRRA